jgi:hypothetical protein
MKEILRSIRCNYFILFLVVFLLSQRPVFAQNARLIDKNNIAWYVSNVSIRLSNKIGIHGEYQWRTIDFGLKNQQGLFRTGINYHLNADVFFRVGYANIETYAYGDFPINAMRKRFTENRIFQMIQTAQKIGNSSFTNRYLLEQRWLGGFSSIEQKKEDLWSFVNRIRYMGRFQFPICHCKNEKIKFYGIVYDEVMIGFGKNVKLNVFDQNRIGFQLGIQFNENSRLEAGYFNQILQLSRSIGGANVFQFNSGYMMNYIHAFDLRKEVKP